MDSVSVIVVCRACGHAPAEHREAGFRDPALGWAETHWHCTALNCVCVGPAKPQFVQRVETPLPGWIIDEER